MTPKVSVCMITYNHEKFIAQAIESVLMQETNFDYELVIGEDCSMDMTREIVLEYKKKYPDKIKLLLPEKNLGMMLNFIQTIQACEGQYIALCEGDDYWTSPQKLQKQVDFLDKHPEFAICSHNVDVKPEGSTQSLEWLGARHKEVSTLEDLLRDGSGGATCSLVFRNRVFGDFPDWYYTIQGGDWALQILCASHGKLRYFREVMGVFRRHDRGARYYQTVAAEAKGEEFIAISSRNTLQICDALNRHFNYRYERLIQKQKANWYWHGAVEYSQYGEKDSARAYFLRALPHIFPLPHWLTFRALLRGLSIAFLPHIFIAFLRSVKSLIKSLRGLVQVRFQGSGDLAMSSLAEKIRKYASEAEAVWGKADGLFDKVIQAKKLKVGAEVGVAYGGHVEAILNISTVDKLYGVDPYRHMENYHDAMNLPQAEFDELYAYVLRRLAPFGERYEHIRKPATQAVDDIPGQIDFVYIDADHTYDSVWSDLCAWYAKVREGGVIGGHDYAHPNFPGVKQAIDEFFRRFDWEIHEEGEGVWWVEKKELNISFVMPTYNSADTVAESVESITQDNFEDGDELIIVDGCSTDNTAQVLSDLKQKYPILKIILNENYLGCPAARNVGIETASNSIIFNLDSDNILVPGSIKQLKQFMIEEEADVAAFGEIHYFRHDKNKITHKWISCPGTLTLADLLSGSINPASSGNYMFTKESWHRIGKYGEYGAGLHEAWGFSLKQIANGSKFVIMSGSYYFHRYGHSSLYVRESAKKDAGSLMATKMIKPFINLLDDEDANYILSEKGSREWFNNLKKRPIKLKSGEIGRTGKAVDANGNPLPKKTSKIQILRAKIISALSRTLPNSIKDIIRGEK